LNSDGKSNYNIEIRIKLLETGDDLDRNAKNKFPGLVLLDRDGTIIVDKHYLSDPDQVELFAGAAEGIRKLNEMNIPVAVVTNQSGIGKGYFTLEAMHSVNNRLQKILSTHQARIDAFYYCPDHPDDHSEYRKPNTGMLEEASREFEVALEEAVIIGDKISDIEAGKRAGAVSILVRTGYGKEAEKTAKPFTKYVVNSIKEAIELVVSWKVKNK